MKRIFTITAVLLLILCSRTAAGQQHAFRSVSGTVADSVTSEPLGFATVALLTADSAYINGTATDSTGRFTVNRIPEEDCILTVSLIGYKDKNIVLRKHTPMDIGSVRLAPDTQMLDAVVVSARRPVIEQKLDKIVMNVADAVSTEGSNGSDLLRKAPGVTIDFDGNVKLNGSTVAVWLDGRPSNLSGKELEVLLNSTDGTTIDRIEIMAHPSSKYDAAGGGGIINIVTKKNFMEGFNGSANIGYGGMYFDRYNQSADGSLSLNYRGRKTNTFLTYSARYDDMTVDIDTKSLYGDDYTMTMSGTSNMIYKDLSQMFRAGNDWYIDDNNVLGAIVNGTFRSSDIDTYGDNFTEHLLNGSPIGRLESDIDNSDRFDGVSANLNYTHTFNKSLSQELTVNADYSWYGTSNKSAQSDIPIEIVPPLLSLDSNIFRQDAEQRIQIWSAKADYQQMFWETGMLEAGLKWSRTITDNNSLREDFSGGLWTENSGLSNTFIYDEQIAAAYISAAKSFGPKWSVKIGLRGEYTYALGDWKSAGETSVKSYFNLFPTAFVSYMPTQKWRLAASYTRRISRPGYSQLNPFRTYMSSNAYTEGNPDLDPQFSDQASLTVGYGQHLNLSLTYQHNSNLIMQRPEVNPDNGEQRVVWENFGTQELAGASFSISELPVTKWLNFSANYFAAYNGNTSADGEYKDGSFMQSFYASVNFLLPKEWKIEIGGFGSGNMTVGYMNISPMYMLFGGIKKNFSDGRGTIALNASDLLRSFMTSITSYTGDVMTYSVDQRINIQKITLSFSWRFGTASNIRRRNVGNVEESSRVGGSTGISTGGMM
ncbi:MAG TPA: TonB-dependent receptor family protein [Candidatus Coprenecus stercoravium]|uniref:TonB-dependent receptor family protein n=1 Tax=Candidatus Coprenecus stercoravium TaxID=2840735 RepID=A0A9D2GQ28_9BACT|nr:TonB-dependent receptor family protein [Candidatus Coprenecus stercoravium]